MTLSVDDWLEILKKVEELADPEQAERDHAELPEFVPPKVGDSIAIMIPKLNPRIKAIRDEKKGEGE